MNIQLLKRRVVEDLKKNINSNLERYLTTNFDDILIKENLIQLEGASVDDQLLKTLDPKSGGNIDVNNALIVYKAINGLNRNIARDERLWAWFTHGPCLEYARERWIKKNSSENTVWNFSDKNIQSHFFSNGNRGIERDNAISSLWWWAEIASQYKKEPIEKVLEVFLHQTDVRASIIERPTSSQVVFNPIMEVLIEKYNSEEKISFFKRTKSSVSDHDGKYRRWLKEINRYGGKLYYDALPESKTVDLFRSLANNIKLIN